MAKPKDRDVRHINFYLDSAICARVDSYRGTHPQEDGKLLDFTRAVEVLLDHALKDPPPTPTPR